MVGTEYYFVVCGTDGVLILSFVRFLSLSVSHLVLSCIHLNYMKAVTAKCVIMQHSGRLCSMLNRRQNLNRIKSATSCMKCVHLIYALIFLAVTFLCVNVTIFFSLCNYSILNRGVWCIVLPLLLSLCNFTIANNFHVPLHELL